MSNLSCNIYQKHVDIDPFVHFCLCARYSANCNIAQMILSDILDVMGPLELAFLLVHKCFPISAM